MILFVSSTKTFHHYKYIIMLSQKKPNATNFHKLLVIDIETVPTTDSFHTLSAPFQEQWKNKIRKQLDNPEDTQQQSDFYDDRAGIYAEFGKIICIGLGYFENDQYATIRLKQFSSDDEQKLLQDFFDLLHKLEQQSEIQFCGHNIKEFDLAYICRRAVILQLALPRCLQLTHIKPWQNPHIDTLELWRFGDYKHYITLELLAICLGVPTSKSDISGKDVAKVYYIEKDLKRIAQYCLKDVYTTALVYLKLRLISYTEVNAIFVD
jgi:predicted PolB exonuclease-like 3'-5' exonuclease